MITVNLMGGLGNQLFQIFATINTAIINNDSFFFIYSNKLVVGKERPTYWNTFLSALKKYTVETPPYGKPLHIVSENGFHYTPIILDKTHTEDIHSRVFMLNGYYQSPKYFEENKTNIYESIGLNEKRGEALIYSPLWISSAVSIHIRLGDYLQAMDSHNIMPLVYYVKALNDLMTTHPEIKKVLVFNEKEDNDLVEKHYLTHLRTNFPTLEFEKIDYNIEDWKQLLMMSLCCHNIIGNSSFSWWGAYLNETENRRVYYPKKWFGHLLKHHNLQDLFPKGWIEIDF